MTDFVRLTRHNLAMHANQWIERLPRGLRVPLNLLRAARNGRFKLYPTWHSLPAGTFEIALSDDLHAIHTRCGYAAFNLECEQIPAFDYYTDANTLIGLGVLPPELTDPNVYEITFRGAKLSYFTQSSVWQPSFASYDLAAQLIDQWSPDDHRVWDVGCGTGVIGLHILRLTPCREALLTDLDPQTINYVQKNAEQMGVSNLTVRAEAFPPLERSPTPFDLIVSNPPWFPPGFLASQSSGPQSIDDLPLTKALIDHGLDHARRVVFWFSSIMLAQVERHLKESNLPGSQWQLTRRRRLPLPLRVRGNPIPGKLPYGVFDEGPDPRFDVWQDIYECELWRA